MLDVALAFIWPDGMMNNTSLEDVKPLPPVSRSFRTTPTADGHVVLVTLTAKQWDGLVDAILTEEDDDTGGDLSNTDAAHGRRCRDHARRCANGCASCPPMRWFADSEQRTCRAHRFLPSTSSISIRRSKRPGSSTSSITR